VLSGLVTFGVNITLRYCYSKKLPELFLVHFMILPFVLIGAFETLQEGNMSLAMSVCPSVLWATWQRGKLHLLLGGFYLNLKFK
jgi:hypothetical protein